jgi:hypothetical protein
MPPPIKHLLIIAAVLLVVGLVYMRIPGTYFCGYDDFLEVHRAAFEDTADPKRVFTTTHFESYKYRPLNRALNLVTYWSGHGDASFFRTRNVLFHLLNIVLVYALAWVLFRRWLTSFTAALLFGLHPLANQAVVGSVMTNTAAHACLLFSLLCFLFSLKKGWGRFVWLPLALIVGWIGVLTYEAAIVVYPMMFAYLVVHYLLTRERLVNWSYVLALTIGSVVCIVAYFAIRAQFVPYSARQAVPGLRTIVKSTAMYTVSLLLPIDWVMANEWFGTPLPSQIGRDTLGPLWLGLAFCAVIIAAVVAWFLLRRFVKQLPMAARSNVLFLLVCVAGVISPLLIFTDKPSETYMYLPVAFAALFVGMFLETVFGQSKSGGRGFFVAVGLLAVLFGCATWVRNNRVKRCGDTAQQIVSSLRQNKLKDGIWFLWLAADPKDPRPVRYGMYGWSNVYTLGETGVQPAAQLVNKNKGLVATVVEPAFFDNHCTNSHDICLWVYKDGVVDQVAKPIVKGTSQTIQ